MYDCVCVCACVMNKPTLSFQCLREAACLERALTMAKASASRGSEEAAEGEEGAIVRSLSTCSEK